jgi:hypothetical protein
LAAAAEAAGAPSPWVGLPVVGLCSFMMTWPSVSILHG